MKCLAKDPDDRWQSAADLKEALKWIKEGDAPDVGAVCEPPLQARLRALPWALGVAIVAALVFALAYLRPARQPGRAVFSSILPPEKSTFDPAAGPVVISPDGTKLAIVARGPSGQDVLWVRPLDSLAAQPLANTEGATYPFWSPDSGMIGFFAHGKLKKIAVSGGPAETLADAPGAWKKGGWNGNGVIIFTAGPISAVYQVPASGGPAKLVTKLDPSQGFAYYGWPKFLPDGRHFLFFALGGAQNSGTYFASLDGGEPKQILQGTNALYAPPGYLLFVRDQILIAQPFDASRLKLTGEPVPLEGVSDLLGLDFSFSETGALVYHPASWRGTGTELLLLDRAGKPIRSLGHGGYLQPAFSPDGKRLALTNQNTGNLDICIDDLANGTTTRLTFNRGANPVWSPDGSHVIFQSNRKGGWNIYEKAANGAGATQALVENSGLNFNPSVSPDGRHLAFTHQAVGRMNFALWIQPLYGDKKSYPLVQNGSDQSFPRFSPDGKWIAYDWTDSVRQEVYILPFPRGDGKWQVSTQGGQQPKWRKDGRELYFLSPDNEMMAVDITERGSALGIGSPHALFQAHAATTRGSLYDVSADGKEFIVASEVKTVPLNPEPAILIENWPALLKKH